MGSIRIKDFKGGLDLRRLPETTTGGTLIHAQDCRVNRGGEVEQRADFVEVYTAPTGATKGLAARADKLVLFGTGTAPGDLPANFDYLQIVHPDGALIDGVRSWEIFGDEIVSVVIFFGGPTNEIYVEETRVSDVNAPPNLVSGGKNPFAVHAQHQKLFAGASTGIFFSALRDPEDWGAGAGLGDGFVDLAFETGKTEAIRAIAKYDSSTALFSPNTISLWQFGEAPEDSQPLQQFFGLGAYSAYSTISYGDGDVVFIHESGIRSLRARDSTRAPGRSDLGAPVDGLVVPLYTPLDLRARALTAAVIEPQTGDLWVAIQDTIFVFSFDEKTKVSAWSTYKPGFVVEYMVVFGNRVYLRDDGDTIYVYGSESGLYSYSSDVNAEFWTPYLDADEPAIRKHVTDFNAVARGLWEVRIGYDPNDTDASDLLGRVYKTTYPDERLTAVGSGTHLSLRFRSLAPKSATEPARLASAMLHYAMDEQENS